MRNEWIFFGATDHRPSFTRWRGAGLDLMSLMIEKNVNKKLPCSMEVTDQLETQSAHTIS
eukprot:scaffold1786_cov104-Skeletonema_dohrnii-CCMP3373.AAC.11